MGVYTRFKKDPQGFRKLVELLEGTSAVKRQKMIDVGMAEDPQYTKDAMALVYTFEDIFSLGDQELVELFAKAPPKISGYAIRNLDEPTYKKFLSLAVPQSRIEMKDCRDMNITEKEIKGAQFKLLGFIRQLEKVGKVKVKKIPDQR